MLRSIDALWGVDDTIHFPFDGKGYLTYNNRLKFNVIGTVNGITFLMEPDIIRLSSELSCGDGCYGMVYDGFDHIEFWELRDGGIETKGFFNKEKNRFFSFTIRYNSKQLTVSKHPEINYFNIRFSNYCFSINPSSRISAMKSSSDDFPCDLIDDYGFYYDLISEGFSMFTGLDYEKHFLKNTNA